jgi:hypothetical protein
MDALPFLWLIGAAGSGKTVTGWALFSRLAAAGVRAAYIDLDQVGMAYPAPEDDGGNERVKARGLGAVWAGFREAGAQCVIASGGVEHAATVADHLDRLPGAAPVLVELAVGTRERRSRLAGRGSAELFEPAEAQAVALQRNPLTAHRIDTGGRTVAEAVELVRARIGDWPGARPGPWPPRELEPPAPAEGDAAPMLWVCGPPGVGKSTVAFDVYLRIMATGVKASFVDLAQIGWCGPAAADDPGDHRLKARNLAALWRAHREAGSRYLVVSGSGGGAATARHYRDAMAGRDLAVVRLDARRDTLAERIRLRGKGIGVELPGDDLRGLADEALEHRIEAAWREALLLERDRIGDRRLATDGRTPADIAEAVFRSAAPGAVA